MITIPSFGFQNHSIDLPQKSNLPRNGSVLELFLGSKDNTSRASREGSMGPLSRQSSTASVGSCCSSSQDAGTSQFFEVLYLGKVKSVSHRKAPPTFIDDVLEKFRTHDQQEQEQQQQLKFRQNSLPVRRIASFSKLIPQSSIEELSTNSTNEHRCLSSNRLVDTQEEEGLADNVLSILKNTEVALQSLSNNIETENHSTLDVVDEMEGMRSRAASGSERSPTKY